MSSIPPPEDPTLRLPLGPPAMGPRRRRESERLARLEQLAEIGKLAAGLAHELKNPLSTLKLNLQLLQEDLATLPGTEPSRNRIQTLCKEADRLAHTVNDFLRYAGRIELRLERVPINAMIKELVDFFLPQAQASQVRVYTSLSAAQPTCHLDANLFKQALLNLMLNAQQAMPKGGELIIRTEIYRGSAIVDIADTGMGIAPEHLERIFDAYFTTKKGGTGLGLPTTRRIIEEHHGHICVTSEAGRGTNFRLELPLASEEPK